MDGDAMDAAEMLFANGVIAVAPINDGTRLADDGSLLTNGGRVICTTALAETLPEALLKSYNRAATITWDGKYLRRDIGQDLLKLLMME
jgi:phosphoribosylamine--glycine ligase